ncbi:MAG: class I SAM-dependent methyltransferase, partial [Chloroflexi bacterium]|nr:class I SAM-dependent methyltransferase [Chloroflexota bacterium]
MCLARGVSPDALLPKYIKRYDIIRYDGRFIVPENGFLLKDLMAIGTTYSFKWYLSDVDNIYEFGCGTGRYLLTLSDLFPGKRLVGLDWAEPSMKLLQLLKESGRNIEGIKFDKMAPS